MKVILLVLIIGILVHERHRGFGETIRVQTKILGRDLKRYLLFVLAAVFAVTYFVDKSILSAIQSVKNPLGTSMIEFGGSVGKNGQFWMGLLLLYGLTKLARSKRATVIVLLTMLSSGLTGLICTVIKITFLRSRPEAGFGETSFFTFTGYMQHERLFLSMPSGDVALVAGSAALCF